MLEIGYVALTIIMSCILIYTYNFGLKKLNVDQGTIIKRTFLLAIGLMLWFIYVYFVTLSGILQTYEMPPRFPLLLIFPLFVFTGILLYKKRNSEFLEVIPSSWALAYQSFRIFIESLFVATVAKGFLHEEVTIKGYNYDMIYACTIPIITFLVFKAKVLPVRFAIVWNYIGLLVIASIIILFFTTMYFPQMWGSETPIAPLEMLHFPYILVASFLMPSAVFVHVFSLLQLNRSR